MTIRTKKYRDYEDYINHQKSKAPPGSDLHKRLLTDLWLSDCDGFRKNFSPYKSLFDGKTKALCLGARTGQEVYVLREMGLEDAIGIDLHACPPLVQEGDVHQLNFEDESFDFIFSNIFDHVLYPEKFLSEIDRVLRPGGHCLLHLSVSNKGTPLQTGSTDVEPRSSIQELLFAPSRFVQELFGKFFVKHPDKDPWASTFVTSSKDVIHYFYSYSHYLVLKDEALEQENWPTFWTLLVQKAHS